MSVSPNDLESRIRAGEAIVAKLAPGSLPQLEGQYGRAGSELYRYVMGFAYGEVLSRPILSLRRRELLTLAMLVSLGAPGKQTRFHVGAALRAGATAREISDAILVASVYAGFPSAISAAQTASEEFEAQKVPPPVQQHWEDGLNRQARGMATLEATSGAAAKRVLETVRKSAPDLAGFLLDHVYGEVLARPNLDPVTKELVQIAAAGARGAMLPQLKVHAEAALNVGASPAEVVEVAHQLAVYSGFPAALNALAAINEVLETPPQVPDRLKLVSVQASALDNNRLGDPISQHLVVYLPPSYGNSRRSYPVVYFLAGFGNRLGRLLGRLAPTADAYFAKHPDQQFIIVEVNGVNRLGGSFWVNSPVTGRWEDMVVNDARSLVERRFRTIKRTSARGIAGYSMGGFAAINFGLKHPQLFSRVSAFSPGLLRPEDLEGAIRSWEGSPTFLLAYGAAFAPDERAPYPFSRSPLSSDWSAADGVGWQAGFGDLDGRIDRYVSGRSRLASLRVAWGKNDSYGWIPRGSEYFCSRMRSKGQPCEGGAFDGVHELPAAQFEAGVLRYFGEAWRD